MYSADRQNTAVFSKYYRLVATTAATAVAGAAAALRDFAGDDELHDLIDLGHHIRETLTGRGHLFNHLHVVELLLHLVHLLAIVRQEQRIRIVLAHFFPMLLLFHQLLKLLLHMLLLKFVLYHLNILLHLHL